MQNPPNRARFWQHRPMDGLSCLAADFTRHDYAPHRHDAFVVAVTEVGGAEFKSRGETDEAKSSVLLVFNPDEPHSGRMGTSRRWRYRGLYVARPAIASLGRCLGLASTPYFMENVFRDPDLIAGFLALHRALDGGEPARQRELLVAAFGTLFGRHGDGPAPPRAPKRDRAMVAALTRMMREEPLADHSLERLATAASLTQFQLIGIFKRTTGMTPHATLTQIRLTAALTELRRGTPIAAAAQSAGFYDQSALTRHFKRSYGITPRQWQKAVTT